MENVLRNPSSSLNFATEIMGSEADLMQDPRCVWVLRSQFEEKKPYQIIVPKANLLN